MNIIIQNGRTLGKSFDITLNGGASNLVGTVQEVEVKDLTVVQYYRANLIGRINKVWRMPYSDGRGISFNNDQDFTHIWQGDKWVKQQWAM